LSSGGYSSESDVIQESVEPLRHEIEERELWEREVLLPSLDRFMADPASAIPIEEVERRLAAARLQRSTAR
jgi:Arc/MetJ-type ribon-helix-helix transcriptional regulator